jgi:hypothetical protein
MAVMRVRKKPPYDRLRLLIYHAQNVAVIANRFHLNLTADFSQFLAKPGYNNIHRSVERRHVKTKQLFKDFLSAPFSIWL